jgi:abortive infection bacteriophage resistance protein
LANYLRPFESDKEIHQFKPGSSLDEALSLYYFDKELRTLIFTALQSIEVALRSKIIHHVSLKYGSFWFADDELAVDKALAADNLARILKDLKLTKEDFIRAHYLKYDTPSFPPVWKTLEVVSFGTLSKLLSNLADVSVKKQIAHDLDLPQHIFLESWISCCVVLRNYIAHHARIWNRKFPIKPQLPHRLKLPWITHRQGDPSKLYAQLCLVSYLEHSIHPDNDFARRLRTLIAAYPTVDVQAMGFPKDWDVEALWRCDRF